MYTNNPLGPNYNEGMVDRLLGKAYLTVKDVHDNLTALTELNSNTATLFEDNSTVKKAVEELTKALQDFEASSGFTPGHDLGTVGDEDPTTYTGDANYITALAKSYDYLETVGKNVEDVNLLAIHINELKAIASALKALLAVSKSLNDVNIAADHIEDIQVFVNGLPILKNVDAHANEIVALSQAIDKFPEIIKSADNIKVTAESIEAVNTCANNIYSIVEVNTRLENASEILQNGALETVAKNAENIATVAEQIKDITTVSSFDSRLTTVEGQVTTNTTELADHESRLSNIETTSDVGKFATKIQELENKNDAQDASITELGAQVDVSITQLGVQVNTDIESLSNSVTTKINDQNTKINKQIDDQNTSINKQITSLSNNLTQQLKDQNTSFTQQLSDQNASVSQQLSDQKNTINQQLSEQTTTVTNKLNNCVTLSAAQSISGNKQFNATTTTAVTATENITVSGVSPDNQLLTDGDLSITIANGKNGEAWTKCIKLSKNTNVITMGDSWAWIGEDAPELVENCILICKWLGDFGLANVISVEG